jgi:hypothetical protein
MSTVGERHAKGAEGGCCARQPTSWQPIAPSHDAGVQGSKSREYHGPEACSGGASALTGGGGALSHHLRVLCSVLAHAGRDHEVRQPAGERLNVLHLDHMDLDLERLWLGLRNVSGAHARRQSPTVSPPRAPLATSGSQQLFSPRCCCCSAQSPHLNFAIFFPSRLLVASFGARRASGGLAAPDRLGRRHPHFRKGDTTTASAVVRSAEKKIVSAKKRPSSRRGCVMLSQGTTAAHQRRGWGGAAVSQSGGTLICVPPRPRAWC